MRCLHRLFWSLCFAAAQKLFLPANCAFAMPKTNCRSTITDLIESVSRRVYGVQPRNDPQFSRRRNPHLCTKYQPNKALSCLVRLELQSTARPKSARVEKCLSCIHFQRRTDGTTPQSTRFEAANQPASQLHENFGRKEESELVRCRRLRYRGRRQQ